MNTRDLNLPNSCEKGIHYLTEISKKKIEVKRKTKYTIQKPKFSNLLKKDLLENNFREVFFFSQNIYPNDVFLKKNSAYW